jgi:hypothetical protein
MSIRLREIPAGCQELVAFNPASFIDALRTPGLDLTQHLRLDHIAVALHDRVCPAILKALEHRFSYQPRTARDAPRLPVMCCNRFCVSASWVHSSASGAVHALFS